MPSRITGADSSRTSEVFDTPETTAPTEAASTAPAQKTGSTRDESTIERDETSGPPPQLPRPPDHPDAGSEGPTITASQLAATAGRLPKDRYGDAMRTIDEALSYGVTDWKITDKDMAAVQSALGSLSKEELRRALSDLSENGRFERFAGRMDASQRAAFVKLCEAQEVFQREPPKQAPKGTGNPPPLPSLLVHDSQLPDQVRMFIHDENVRAYKNYRVEHDAYLDRYRAEIDHCNHPLGLKQVGDPVEPARVKFEPGSTRNTQLDRDLESSWRRLNDECSLRLNDAYIARSERAAALAGRMAPMQVALTGEVKVEAELDKSVARYLKPPEVSLKGRIGPDGKATGELSGEPLRPKYLNLLKGDLEGGWSGKLGETEAGLKLKKTAEGDFRAEAELGVAVAYSEVNDHGKVSAGVGRKFELGGLSAEATVGVEVQLADAELNATAISMPGMSEETFPELQEGRTWKTLSPERQRQLTLRGFNQGTWDDVIRNRPEFLR